MDNGIGLKIILTLAKPLGAASFKKLQKLKPIEQFRIEQAIENAIAEVWDSLDPFLTSENVEEHKRTIIATACEYELRPFADNVTLLLNGSLDGEKLFEQLRAVSPFPQAIRDEGLEQIYRMVFPLVASVLCKAPVILEQIEKKGLAEILARFDQLKDQVSSVSAGIAQVRNEPQWRADELFNRVLQQGLKKILLGVEVTGLYGDSPLKQAKEEMFVLPSIQEIPDTEKQVQLEFQINEADTPIQHVSFFLAKKHRSIVRGAPGAGKSTWSRWLQAYAMRDRGVLALHVKLRSWQHGTLPTVLELLSKLVGPNMAAEIDALAVARWVSRGKIAVLFDGFDEVAPHHREDMIRAIKEMADYLRDGPCLITSRPLHSDHLENLSRNWISWKIQPFDEARILDYIGRWYRHAPLKEGANRDVNAYDLHSILTQDPHVEPLTSNPLMLATLLMVHHNDGELPKGRSRLYSRYIDGMLGIWDDRQEVHADVSGLDRDKKKRVLTSLAVALHVNNKDELGDTDTLSLISAALKSYGEVADAQRVLDSLRERSGLIIGPGSYSFSHKSVGEFLVAQAICDGDRVEKGERLDRFLLAQKRSNDRWLNVVYFWAGSAPVAEVKAFIESLDYKNDLTLRLGLLWDQMDRFQTDWLGDEVWSSIKAVDQVGDLVDGSRGHYMCCRFDCSSPKGAFEAAASMQLQLRHVSLTELGGKEFRQLLVKIGLEWEKLHSLKRPACFNWVFFTLLANSEDIATRLNIVARNTRWPDYMRKYQFAWILLRSSEPFSPEQVTAIWQQNFGDGPDSAELWSVAAVTMDLEIGVHREIVSMRQIKIVHELLRRPWSDETLKLTLQFVSSVEQRGQTRDLLERFTNVLNAMLKNYGRGESEFLERYASARDAAEEKIQMRRGLLI